MFAQLASGLFDKILLVLVFECVPDVWCSRESHTHLIEKCPRPNTKPYKLFPSSIITEQAEVVNLELLSNKLKNSVYYNMQASPFGP